MFDLPSALIVIIVCSGVLPDNRLIVFFLGMLALMAPAKTTIWYLADFVKISRAEAQFFSSAHLKGPLPIDCLVCVLESQKYGSVGRSVLKNRTFF